MRRPLRSLTLFQLFMAGVICAAQTPLPVSSGGTGATNAPAALNNLGGVAQTGGTMTGPLIGPSMNTQIQNGALYYVDRYCPITGTYTQTCLTNALSAIGENSATLIIDQKLPITSTQIIPSNVIVRFEGTGSVNISSLQYIQFEGPISAGLYQVFYGAGSVYFYGGTLPGFQIYPQWFGATGSGKAAGYSATAGNSTITLAPLSLANFVTGDTVTLVGAGPSGTDLAATLSVSGSTITSSPAPSTTVSLKPIYTEDDSPALNSWANSIRGNTELSAFYDTRSIFGPAKLYLPKGTYQVCSTPVLLYTSTVLEAEPGSTNVGGTLSQCNPFVSVLRISANGFTPSGTPINYGNGNSYFAHVKISGTYAAGDQVFAPAIQYLNAGNLHSDNRWDHPMFESVNGVMFQLGFVTSLVGTVTSGATTVTIADGSTFCTKAYATALNERCSAIIIVGAGASGANLTAHIVSGVPATPVPGFPSGHSYTVAIDTTTLTTVTNPTVYPGSDINGELHIEHPEMDGGNNFVNAHGNASGDLTVDDGEIFNAQNGAFIGISLSPISLTLLNTQCYGCGFGLGDSTNSAIYWQDLSKSQTNNVFIRGDIFEFLNMGEYLSGPIMIFGANRVDISNTKFHNTDNVGSYKGVLVLDAKDFNLSENQFYWDAVANIPAWGSSAIINTNSTLGQTPVIHYVNNSFINNSGTNATYGFMSDVPLPGAVISDNTFSGTSSFGIQYAVNIASNNVRNTLRTTQNIQKYGTAVPTAGTWYRGDIIWNSNVTSGQPVGWVCTVPGVPGTWAIFGTVQ